MKSFLPPSSPHIFLISRLYSMRYLCAFMAPLLGYNFNGFNPNSVKMFWTRWIFLVSFFLQASEFIFFHLFVELNFLAFWTKFIFISLCVLRGFFSCFFLPVLGKRREEGGTEKSIPNEDASSGNLWNRDKKLNRAIFFCWNFRIKFM